MGMIHRHKIQGVTSVAPTSNVEEKVVEKVTTPETETKTYTKSEIVTMSTAKLKELANSIGIEGADDISGNKLKPIIIAKLGL